MSVCRSYGFGARQYNGKSKGHERKTEVAKKVCRV